VLNALFSTLPKSKNICFKTSFSQVRYVYSQMVSSFNYHRRLLCAMNGWIGIFQVASSASSLFPASLSRSYYHRVFWPSWKFTFTKNISFQGKQTLTVVNLHKTRNACSKHSSFYTTFVPSAVKDAYNQF